MLGLAGARGGHIGTIQVVGGGEIEAGVGAVSRRVVVVVVVVVVTIHHISPTAGRGWCGVKVVAVPGRGCGGSVCECGLSSGKL